MMEENVAELQMILSSTVADKHVHKGFFCKSFLFIHFLTHFSVQRSGILLADCEMWDLPGQVPVPSPQYPGSTVHAPTHTM